MKVQRIYDTTLHAPVCHVPFNFRSQKPLKISFKKDVSYGSTQKLKLID